MLAEWIISYFPQHRVYVEPYGGAASVLLRKARSYAEVYNDLDGEVVNVFRVVRDRGEELKRVLSVTPFAREEFGLSWYGSDDPLEQARRTIIRSFMGFASAAVTLGRHVDKSRGGKPGTGFRSNSNRSGTTPAHDWNNFADALEFHIERLRGVVIEKRDALEVMEAHDGPKTLHYVDPPYVHTTRDSGIDYAFEMDDDKHRELAKKLWGLKGMVIISGYQCDLYEEIYTGWNVVERDALADGALKRKEFLWFNKAAWEFRPHSSLFQNSK